MNRTLAAASLALIFSLASTGALGAGEVVRAFEDRTAREVVGDLDVLILDVNQTEPSLSPYGASSKVKLLLGEKPEVRAPLHSGQADRVFAFIVAPRDGANYGVNFAFLVPDPAMVPNLWIPKEAQEWSAKELLDQIPEAYRSKKVKAYIMRGSDRYFTQEKFDKLLAAGKERPFPVQVEPKRGDAPIPSSIAGRPNIEMTDGGGLTIRFDDPGMAEVPEQTRYAVSIKWYSFDVYEAEHRPVCEGEGDGLTFPTAQVITIAPDAPGFKRALKERLSYNLSITVKKPIYGQVKVAPTTEDFTYRKGTTSQPNDPLAGYDDVINQ